MSTVQELPFFADASNETTCTWFFAMFVVASLYGGFLLVMNLLNLSMAKWSIGSKVAILILSLLATGAIVANAGFTFTMCKRSLIG
jgi:hypothetical protein